MKNNEKIIGLLNDLIKINNDRYDAYASLLSKNIILDRDLWVLICKLASQSRSNSSRLITEVIKLRNTDHTDVSKTAGIYYDSLGLKDDIDLVERHGIIECCRHREEIVQKAYYDALSLGIELSETVESVLNDQKREIKTSEGLFMVNQPSRFGHAA